MLALLIVTAWFAASVPVGIAVGRALGRNSRSLEHPGNAPTGRQ